MYSFILFALEMNICVHDIMDGQQKRKERKAEA